MRILFISNFHQLYGANRSLLSIMERCKANGDQICLLIPKKGDFSGEIDRRGGNYMAIPYYSQLFYYKMSLPYLSLPLLVLGTLFLLPYLIIKVRRFNPDVIYSNNSAENLGIFIARIIGAKHISHIREFMDLDLDRYFIFGRRAKKRFINLSDGVVYVTHAVAKHILMGDTLPANHRVIYNGVNIPDISFVPHGIPTQLNFGIVGLLYPGKGQDMAIRFYSKIKEKYPNSKLHIWGDRDGAYKHELLMLIKNLNLEENVIFHGFEKSPTVIYHDMHVLFMCSRAEGFGRVTIEAMSRGIPVLGYRSGGTAELVKDGYNGYTFGTFEEFEKGLQQLLSSDDKYNAICINALKDAKDNYSENIYTERVYNFINYIKCKG